MLAYILRRVVMLIPVLFAVSIVTFFIIQLPPGDYVTSYVARLRETGEAVDRELAETLREQYGLDKPFVVQYLKWIAGVLRGNFGYSFDWQQPVSKLIWERLGLTFVVSLCSLLFVYLVAIPIGIFSATHQYKVGDYIFSVVSFLGKATPNFLFALVLMFVLYKLFGLSIGGLFSAEFIDAPWTLAKAWDMFKHLWIPVIVIGTNSTCSIVRIMRATLLDELRKQYVVTARAKGIPESRVLFKYPVRVAINPILSTIGWQLPHLISGATITAIVLNLPTTGPLLLQALLNQDMYLAGSFLLILASMMVIGTLISDILLALSDPRIRFARANG